MTPLLIEKVAMALKAHPPDKLSCLQIAPVHEGSFCVFEGSDGRSYVVAREEEIQAGQDYLLVRTNFDLPIGFIAVDKCLIKKSGKRCDAALCWNAEIVLLDLKLDTKNEYPGTGTTDGFHKQIKGTINFLQDTLKIAMSDFSIRLCIVFPAATITTTMSAELLGLESDIFNLYGLNTQYVLIPDTPSIGISPVLNL